jgi:hypothetical protein
VHTTNIWSGDERNVAILIGDDLEVMPGGFVFAAVDFRAIGPGTTRNEGAANDAVETRVKIVWFRWLPGVKQPGK